MLAGLAGWETEKVSGERACARLESVGTTLPDQGLAVWKEPLRHLGGVAGDEVG